jgi:hypothetical protein
MDLGNGIFCKQYSLFNLFSRMFLALLWKCRIIREKLRKDIPVKKYLLKHRTNSDKFLVMIFDN